MAAPNRKKPPQRVGVSTLAGARRRYRRPSKRPHPPRRQKDLMQIQALPPSSIGLQQLMGPRDAFLPQTLEGILVLRIFTFLYLYILMTTFLLEEKERRCPSLRRGEKEPLRRQAVWQDSSVVKQSGQSAPLPVASLDSAYLRSSGPRKPPRRSPARSPTL
ncbi:hypothetical protein MRX96_021715 [Rhipicephalus microplus]